MKKNYVKPQLSCFKIAVQPLLADSLWASPDRTTNEVFSRESSTWFEDVDDEE